MVAVDNDGDIKVEIDGKSWFYSPMCLLPEEKGKEGETTDDEGKERTPITREMIIL